MRVAHIADPHIGLRQYHRQNPGGINQREADIAAAFRVAVDGIVRARPDAVLIAGDLFHSVRPTNAAILFAFRQFQRLRTALPDAPIVLIAGNHDTPRSVETGSILRLFEEAGLDVVIDEARRLVFPHLGLSVLAVPHQALVSGAGTILRPDGDARYQVLMLHGEVEGVFPVDRSVAEYGGAVIGSRDLAADEWSYVALGHYHVQCQVARRAWYAGALDYVGPNLWGELRDERERGTAGKGWLLVDLETGEVERQPVPPARAILDLLPVEARDLSSGEVDAHILHRVLAVPGGIAGKIIRLRVRDIPRHVARQIDHSAIRGYKLEALHFHLDLRRPESTRLVGVGAPGRRQTLPELVHTYLERRSLPAHVDRTAFVQLGDSVMDAVEREFSSA